MISNSTIEELKSKIDVLEVAELFVELKKAGSIYKGLSPFGFEKTPSFVVSPSKNIWNDFSSGVGGDAIKLFQLVNNMTFPEAVEELCEKYNVTMVNDNVTKNVLSRSELEQYSKWCCENLKKSEIQTKYLKNRGLTIETIEKFQIGLSPSSREVVDFVKSNFLNVQNCIDVGIIDNGERGLYARFIDRIMFPIFDVRGKICGFSGRTINGHVAKYINTRDTELFKKSALLYGFNFAREKISKKNFFILSEGQIDIALQHQVGIKYAIASMGTALTEIHVKAIKRVANKGIVAYDGDPAGIKAAIKACGLFMKNGVEVRVVLLDDGQDPADMISQGKSLKYWELLKKGIKAIDFCVARILGQFDIKNPYQVEEAQKELSLFAKNMPEAIEKEILNIGEQKTNCKILKTVEKYVKPKKSTLSLKEKELLKYVLENKHELGKIISIKKCFSNIEVIQLLEDGKFEDTRLTEIILDEDIWLHETIDEEVLLFKIECLQKHIQKLPKMKLSSIRRATLIRDGQNKLRGLRNELKEQRGDN